MRELICILTTLEKHADMPMQTKRQFLNVLEQISPTMTDQEIIRYHRVKDSVRSQVNGAMNGHTPPASRES